MTEHRPGRRPPHSGPLERHWSRTHSGSEPVTARSALRVRLILATLFTPLFLAATGLFWYWMTQTGPGDAPGVGSLRTLTLICAGLALFSVVDLTVVLLRRKRARFSGDHRGTEG
ncbi:MAG: DUF6343 family protein [Streptomyces sp.]|uniref:DUF6343 family protein n=1 Tax=Streptomyces sp. TaxID=1931 RepID=UPI003D6B5DD0